MQNRIHIEGIKLYGYHGCLEEESKIGGNYIIDVYMTVDFMDSAVHDDLSKTVDYCDIYEIAKRQMAVRSKLIEQVCMRIFNETAAKFPQLNSLKVKITKLLPPMNGNVEKVSVEMEEEFKRK